jgi:hypothetical protein
MSNNNKIYKMTVKYLGRPNGYKIYQHLSLRDIKKFTQIAIFDLKTCYLATLVVAQCVFANIGQFNKN